MPVPTGHFVVLYPRPIINYALNNLRNLALVNIRLSQVVRSTGFIPSLLQQIPPVREEEQQDAAQRFRIGYCQWEPSSRQFLDAHQNERLVANLLTRLQPLYNQNP